MKGDNVYLRPVELEDVKHIYNAINFTEIGKIMGILPMTYKSQADWYQSIPSDSTKYVFAICTNEGDDYLGNVAITNIDWINRHGMFSIFLIEKGNRGKGYGLEATQLLIDFAFNRLNLNKIHLKTSPEYVEAIRIYKRLSFTEDGILKAHEYSNGKYQDKLIFSLLRDNYKP